MDRFWIGMFARAFNSSIMILIVVAVERPQDVKKKGEGLAYLETTSDVVLKGIDSKQSSKLAKFTCIKPKSTIVIANGLGAAIVKESLSDTELILENPFEGITTVQLRNLDASGAPIGLQFHIVPHVDQSQMFQSVVERLSKGQAVGVFPEGGSHDRTELLPLKPGCVIMALETLRLFPGTKLKIIPTGLHYFNGDKFRSRAVIEFGKPIEIPLELVQQYSYGGIEKRKAIGLLLDTVTVAISSLTVQTADFDSLMVYNYID